MRATLSSMFLCAAVLNAAPNGTVHLSRGTFNPTQRQSVEYAITITAPGVLTARILDRDTYVTKTLANQRHVEAGTTTLRWDGTDDRGAIVPDEAWTLRVDFHNEQGSWTYFPASSEAAMQGVRPEFYDRSTGILRYTLASAARVHVQAGTADVTRDDRRAGAVLKTLVNREPRIGGAIIEQWDGYDESKTIYVPELNHFVVGIAVTALPESAVITTGNKTMTFLAAVLRRHGEPLGNNAAQHDHHQQLATLDDLSPQLTIAPRNARHEGTAWMSAAKTLILDLTPTGPTATRFLQHPATLELYIDGKLARLLEHPRATQRVTLPLDHLTGGRHVIAANWQSGYGPVAANAFFLERTP